MIKIEEITITDGLNEITLKKTYSDSNLKIQKIGTNEMYDEAMDVLDSEHMYIETDKYTTDYILKLFNEGKITQEEMNELL